MNAIETEVDWSTYTIGFSSPNHQARDILRIWTTTGLTVDTLAEELTTALNHFLPDNIRVTADGRIFLSGSAQELTAMEASREVFRAHCTVADVSRKHYAAHIRGMFNVR